VQQRQLRTKWLLCSTRFFCVREFIKPESATAVQRAFRLRFNIHPPTRKSIRRWNHQFELIGCLCKGKVHLFDSRCTNCLGSMITNVARRTRELQSGIAMAKTALNKGTLFTSKLALNLWKKSVKCYIWNIAFYGVGTRLTKKADRNFNVCYPEVFNTYIKYTMMSQSNTTKLYYVFILFY
jgi:hypothetical protein